MNRYFALHATKGSPEEGWKYFNEAAPELAVAMAEGRTPARIIKTWSPYDYGRTDYVFCLWEAEKPEDVFATLALTRLPDYVATDLMQVAEIDWAAMAEQAKTPATA